MSDLYPGKASNSMPPFPRYPIFYTVILSFGVVTAAAAWRLRSSFREIQSLQSGLLQKRAELQTAKSQLKPAQPGEIASLIETLVRARAALGERELAIPTLASTVREDPAPWANSTDAFFDLAVFAERMRSKAKSFDVRLKSDERFGFSEYAMKGPAEHSLTDVAQRRTALEYLLERLFEAEPRELISVQRARPENTEPGAAAPRLEHRGSPSDAADFFELDSRLSVRVAGVLETEAFRVSFLGRTASLRSFLNALAASHAPCSVRSVSAEPASQSRHGGVTTPDATDDRVLIQPGELVFTVTVEFLRVVNSISSASS